VYEPVLNRSTASASRTSAPEHPEVSQTEPRRRPIGGLVQSTLPYTTRSRVEEKEVVVDVEAVDEGVMHKSWRLPPVDVMPFNSLQEYELFAAGGWSQTMPTRQQLVDRFRSKNIGSEGSANKAYTNWVEAVARGLGSAPRDVYFGGIWNRSTFMKPLLKSIGAPAASNRYDAHIRKLAHYAFLQLAHYGFLDDGVAYLLVEVDGRLVDRWSDKAVAAGVPQFPRTYTDLPDEDSDNEVTPVTVDLIDLDDDDDIVDEEDTEEDTEEEEEEEEEERVGQKRCARKLAPRKAVASKKRR
jgi:hypothetical protein